MRWEKWNGDCIVPLSNQSMIYWLDIFIDWLRPRRDNFNRVFVPLNDFFSTIILNPSLEIGTGYEVLTTFTACRERPSIWALPFCWGLLCRSGLAVRTAGKYQQGNQRSSQLRWFIFVQIAYWQMRSNVLKWVGRLRSWRPKFPLYHAAQILSSVFLHKF